MNRKPEHCTIHRCRQVAVLCPIIGQLNHAQLCPSHGYLFLVEHDAVWGSFAG